MGSGDPSRAKQVLFAGCRKYVHLCSTIQVSHRDGLHKGKSSLLDKCYQSDTKLISTTMLCCVYCRYVACHDLRPPGINISVVCWSFIDVEMYGIDIYNISKQHVV